jgi:hypothetical protein
MFLWAAMYSSNLAFSYLLGRVKVGGAKSKIYWLNAEAKFII